MNTLNKVVAKPEDSEDLGRKYHDQEASMGIHDLKLQ